jgi:hypothetical protein
MYTHISEDFILSYSSGETPSNSFPPTRAIVTIFEVVGFLHEFVFCIGIEDQFPAWLHLLVETATGAFVCGMPVPTSRGFLVVVLYQTENASKHKLHVLDHDELGCPAWFLSTKDVDGICGYGCVIEH